MRGLAVAVLSLWLAACAGDSVTDTSSVATTDPGALAEQRPSPSTRFPTTADVDPDAVALPHLVIVTLDVDWRPEPNLSAEEIANQRDRVAQAQQRMLQALGPEGELRRELHATAQVSMAVSDAGLAELEDLPEVAAVHRDLPEPTN